MATKAPKPDLSTLPVKAEARNLNFFYGPKQALKSINLPIYDRRVTALIGPSGCGKSTFLRCFNRMHDLYPGNRYEGEIRFYPDDINLLGPDVDPIEVRMRLSMVFQKPNPFPKSIFENVAYGLRVRGVNQRSVLLEKVEEALTDAALWNEVKDRLDDLAVNLSGGQQQRLCIARALAADPELLLQYDPDGIHHVLGIVPLHFDGWHGDHMATVDVPVMEGCLDLFLGVYVLDLDDLAGCWKVEGFRNLFHHPHAGPDDEDSFELLPLEALDHLLAMLLVMEESCLYRSHVGLFLLGGSSGQDLLVPDQKSIVHDQFDPVLLGEEHGPETFPRSTLPHEGKDLDPFQKPYEMSVDVLDSHAGLELFPLYGECTRLSVFSQALSFG
jgi:ABC-type phosphate transport system ATPase subunit